MFIEVALTACLVAKPLECKDYQLRFEAERAPTPQQCITNAMPEMAKWQESHPNQQITRFACGKPSKQV